VFSYFFCNRRNTSFDDKNGVEELCDAVIAVVLLGILLHSSNDLVNRLSADFFYVTSKHNENRLHLSVSLFLLIALVGHFSLCDEVHGWPLSDISLVLIEGLFNIAIIDFVTTVFQDLQNGLTGPVADLLPS